MTFHLTQGTFSFLPPLTDEEICLQIQYCLDHGWSINIEFTDDSHPRNTCWEMWGLPMFDIQDPVTIMYKIQECRKACPHHYIRVSAYARRKGRQTLTLSFMVHRPSHDPGFGLVQREAHDRLIRYTLHIYEANQPAGERFAG